MKPIETIAIIILSIVVIFSLVSGMSNSIVTSTRAVSEANNCTEFTDKAGATLYYNRTTQTCFNSTPAGDQDLGYVGFYELPLSSLFAEGGVLVIILMIGIILTVIGVVIWRKRK